MPEPANSGEDTPASPSVRELIQRFDSFGSGTPSQSSRRPEESVTMPKSSESAHQIILVFVIFFGISLFQWKVYRNYHKNAFSTQLIQGEELLWLNIFKTHFYKYYFLHQSCELFALDR